MSFIDDSIKRLREEEKERRKREQAAQLIRGPQSSSNSNSTNSSTSSQNSSQTSQGGSQSPSAVDKLFHSTARKYTNATANDNVTKNNRNVRSAYTNSSAREKANSKKSENEPSRVSDIGKWLGNEFMAGIASGNEAVGKSIIGNAENINKTTKVPFLDRLAGNLLPNGSWNVMKLAGELGSSKLAHDVDDYFSKENEKRQQNVAELRGDSGLREKVGNLTQVMSEQLPMLAYSLLSGGSGGAASGVSAYGKQVATSLVNPASLSTYGNYITRAVAQAGQNMSENPYFWDTFLKTFGPAYYKEKDEGANDAQALVSAATNSFAQSAIEIGGGFETAELKEGFLNKLKEVIKSSGEEGSEEIWQDIVDNLTHKALGSNKSYDEYNNLVTTPWFSTVRGKDAVINPANMIEQGAYGAVAGGLMTGTSFAGRETMNAIANSNYRNANPDLEERANELIQRASLQEREGEMATRAQNLAEEVSDQMARGEAPTAYQMRELERAVATDEYYNDKAYQESSQERYNQAVNEGRANTVESTGTADEYYGFQRGLTETEQRNYERAKAVMGEDASERSVVAVGRFMTGSESNSDIDTILLDPKAKSAVEELTDVTLPINNTKARAELENLALAHNIANNDRILEETHNEIRTNMSRRGGEFFDKNYDEAVATINEPNAANIYENFFSRFYTAGTVEGADFEKTYNRIISPLVEDFGEDLGTKISQVFTHDFAQKVFAEGQIAMNSVRAKAQGKRLSVKASENPSGFTYEAEARKHISDKEAELFTKLAERAKVHIRLVSSIAGGKANGSYDPETGVILIAADSDNKFITVFKHELTHHLKNTSPEMYQKLEDFVFKRWYDGDPEKMEERVQEYQRRYGMKPDEAREEIIADASEAFFTDEGAINDAVTFNEKMARAIHDGIKSLLDTFLDLVDTDRRADKGYGDFLEDLDILRDAEKMWLEALNESVGRSKAQAGTESKAKGEVKHSLKDSDGNTLSKGQQEYFANSKVVDSKGNLKVMYHGSPNDFDTFDIKRAKAGLYGRGFYFTDSKNNASLYGNTYSVYLDVETPLQTGSHDITRAQLKNFIKVLAEDEDYGIENYGYGATVDSVLKSVWGKDDFAMLQDLNASSVGDFAEAVKLFNKVNGTSYDGIIAPTETIVFYPEQIKEIENKNPTKNPNIHFSMKESVEETKNLLAVHNLKAEDLRGALDLGGFPMPSIAIIKAAAGHDMYGDFSAIFDKKSIDPKASSKNVIYGGDAWTPTFPHMQFKPNDKVAKRISEFYYENARRLGYDVMRPLQNLANEPEDALNREGGEAALIEGYKNNPQMMRMFLRVNDNDVETVVKRTETTLSDGEISLRNHFINAFGEDGINEFAHKDAARFERLNLKKEWVKEHKDEISEVYSAWLKENGFTEGQIKTVLDNMKLMDYMSLIQQTQNYIEGGATTVKEETDIEATNKAVEEKAKEQGYDKWVDDLLKGIEEKKGIRNNTEFFTRSGNRRSWEALHDEPTLVNIVNVMAAQDNGETIFGSSLKAVGQKRYKNISEVRADKGRLKTISEEEYKELMDSFAERENEIITRIDEASPTYEDNPFIRHDEIRSTIVDNVRKGMSKAAFLNDLKKWASTKGATAKDVDDIFDLVRDVANIPTGYFEAKPKRPVTFEEVKALLAPSDAPNDLISRLQDEGVDVVQYEAGNNEDRIAKLNQAAEKTGTKFSLKKDPDQLDFFDMLKSKGVDDENARIGSEALADTGKLKSKSKAKKKKNPYNTLAVSFYEKMIQDGSATLVGHKFKNKHDLAQALQMYRDPRYETCRLFFLDKNNKIVMQTGVTQRLPSMSAIFAGTTNEENERYISNVFNSATKRGAVAFYTSHNHPSGNPEPSRDDYGVNRRFKSLADQSNGKLKYRGQIVIDHNTYAYISPGKTPSNFGEGADIYSMYSAKKAEDPLHKTDDESKRMGMNQQLRNQNAIADLLMSLNVPEDHATLLYLSTQLRGKAIQSMDLGHFAESDSYHIRQELIKNAKDFGAYAVALGMNETNDARTRLILEDLYENGALLDVFIYDKNNGYTNFDADDSKQRGWGSLWDEEARNAPEQVGEQFKYSLKSNGESRFYQSTITKLENQVKDLKSEFKRTNLKTADQKQVRIQAGKLITRHGSNMQAQKSLTDTFNEIFKLYKEKGTDAFDEVYEIAKNEAVNIVNNISVVHNEGEETYKAIKDYLRNTPITISEDMKRNITDFNDFRKRYFGKLKITNGNTTNIDTVYMELMELFPEQFTEDYVNPADQLYHMADVLDNYAPYYETLDGASEEMQDYVVDIAADIMETAYGLQTKKTFADKKYEEKVRAVEKARQKALESRDVALDRQKKRYEKKLNDLKQHNKDVREGRRERKEESELRSKLLKVARRLDKMKTTKENRTLIQNLIGDMDLVAKSMTGKTLNDLNDLRNWYDEQKEADPFFYDSNVEAKLKRLTKKQIANMDLNDVRDLNEVLRAIETSIRTADKFLKSYYNKSVKKAGLEVIEDVNNSKGVKDNPLGTIDRFFINGTLSPERQIHRITGYNDNDPLYVATKELSKGQRDMLFYQMNSWNMFKKFMKDKQFINSLNGKRAREIELSAISKGKETTIKVTPDVAISLYLSSMNDDNMRHMGVGGVEIPDIKAYKNGELKKAYRNSTRVTFSKEQLAAIEGSLTKQEKAFADTAHEYYNSVAPKAINEVSEILKGYSLAQVENYFPIQVNKNFLDRDFESLKFDGTIEGMGSLKERVKASNPIVINGIVDTITRSINENSMYVGLAIPVRNYSKLLGVKNITYTESDRGGKTETKVEYNGSVNESISKKWGDQAMKYIEKFMTDLQTSRGSDDDWEAVLNKWRSNYAGAVLTLNASVAIKQAASYPTAMAVLGAKPLARAMADVGKVDLDLIEKYTPLQWYRSQGYSTKELGDIRAGRKGSAVDKLTSVPILNWIQAMDVLTTRKLWKASEYYVRQNNRSLKQGSDEYYKAVADIYNRVIEETQPNYTVMQRPGLLRSDKSMVQMLNMFKTQPYQNFNILYDSIGNYKAKAKVYKKDKSSKAQADVKKAYKDMQNAVLSQVLQLAVFAAMTSLWALFRGKDDKWRDEDGKLSIESYMKQLGKDMLSGSAAMIPLGADLYNAISSAITGDYYYGFSSVTDSSISDLFNSLNQTMTLIPSVAEYAKERRPGEPIPDDLKKSSKKLLENTSRFSGIPYSNLRNLWDGVYRWAAIAGHGEYVGEYLSQKATFAKTSVMMDNLYKAYRNDKAQYDELRQMMIDDGIKESSIDYAMKDRMKKNKTEAEQKEYDDSISTLEKSALWRDADAEDKEDYEKIIEKIAVGIEDSDTTPITKYAASGLTEEQIILYKLALKKVDTPNKNGKLGGTPTNAEREAAVRLLEKEFNLTYAQKEALKG